MADCWLGCAPETSSPTVTVLPCNTLAVAYNQFLLYRPTPSSPTGHAVSQSPACEYKLIIKRRTQKRAREWRASSAIQSAFAHSLQTVPACGSMHSTLATLRLQYNCGTVTNVPFPNTIAFPRRCRRRR